MCEEDLEDARGAERGWRIPEAVSQLGDEQSGDVTQEALQPSGRGEVPGRHGDIPDAAPQ